MTILRIDQGIQVCYPQRTYENEYLVFMLVMIYSEIVKKDIQSQERSGNKKVDPDPL
jgi:hypothetical protein